MRGVVGTALSRGYKISKCHVIFVPFFGVICWMVRACRVRGVLMGNGHDFSSSFFFFVRLSE